VIVAAINPDLSPAPSLYAPRLTFSHNRPAGSVFDAKLLPITNTLFASGTMLAEV
jgi:hypothetical protein